MYESLWCTLSTFDFLCPPHEWIGAILSCAKQCWTVQTGIISKHWFYWRSWRLKIDFRWILCMFGSHTYLPTSWICKKQTSVSHSSTEAEIISLDAVVRMDGIPTLEDWLLKCFILPPTENRDTKSQRRETCSSTDRQTNTPTPKPRFSYRTKILSCPLSIMSPQTWNLIAVQPCASYLER